MKIALPPHPSDSGAQGLDLRKSDMDSMLGFMGSGTTLSFLVEPSLTGEPERIEENFTAIRRRVREKGLTF